MITVRLSGKSLLARSWDAGIALTDELRETEPLHYALGVALKDSKYVKAGKGYSRILDIDRPLAEYLLKDLKDWSALYLSDREPESTQDAQALKRDAERLERSLSNILPAKTTGLGVEGYYVEGRKLFSKNFSRRVDRHTATLLIGKTLRHFKVYLKTRKANHAHDFRRGYVSIRFAGRDSGGVRYTETDYPVIRIAKFPSVGIIAHEAAHVIAARHGEYKDNTLNFDKWHGIVQHWLENHAWVAKVTGKGL